MCAWNRELKSLNLKEGGELRQREIIEQPETNKMCERNKKRIRWSVKEK